MAQVQITYWRDFPSLVTAQAGRRNRARVELPARFQVAIDEAAMRLGMDATDAYLEQWRKGDWVEVDGAPDEVAHQVAAQLQDEYTPARIRAMLDDLRA